jgi:Uma2 family endonuclease
VATRPLYVPRYTIADYRQWRGDWQLIDGVAIAMTPSPFGPHERVVSRLSRIIGTQLDEQRCPCEVYTNLDWIITAETVVRPDLMVVCGEQPTRHLERPPTVVVEVLSEATRAHDLGAKRAVYREQDVPHYLMIDPETRTVEHLAAVESRTLMATDHLELTLGAEGGCRLVIPCARLFD